MADTIDYKLGELVAKVEDIDKKLDVNSAEHKELFTSIKELNIWRWKVIGASSVVMAIVSVLVNILSKSIHF